MSKAKIITDSISESGIRITTMELEFERFLLAQFNTHRMFSRSAQSSRAVPVEKMIENAKQSKPLKWTKNAGGMQALEFLNESDSKIADKEFYQLRDGSIYCAEKYLELGLHKQHANRAIEGFTTVKVVVTATEWQNFFDLRLHHAAQPEMQSLAQAMKAAIDESKPVLLCGDDWHLPYVTDDEFYSFGTDGTLFENWRERLPLISAARCARVSYLNHDNSSPDIEKDLELAQRLLADGHLSPFEHQANPMDLNIGGFVNGQTHMDKNGDMWSGNFKGWIQHRQIAVQL